MEKNTKILLGLGAVIAAYLILKPKKTQTDGNELNDNGNQIATINMPTISEDERDCNIQYAMSAKLTDMVSEETRALRQANFIKRCMEQKERRKEEEQNCVCVKAPCNCGNGGVKLDVLIPTQSSEY